MKKILITGATSYIGTCFARFLEQWPDQYRVEAISLRDGSWQEKSFAGYDCVYHVAAVAHIRETEENAHLYEEVDRDLAVRVARKAKADGVGQFVFASSMSVYGMVEGVITGDTPTNPVTHYGRAKLEAERQIAPLGSENFKVVILRPPMVYGEGCRGNYQSLVKFAKRMPVFPAYRNQRSMIHVDGLSSLVKDLIDREAEGIYLPQDKDFVCTANMVQDIGKRMGKKIRLWKIFNPGIRILVRCTNVGKKAFGTLCYEAEPSEEGENYIVSRLELKI